MATAAMLVGCSAVPAPVVAPPVVAVAPALPPNPAVGGVPMPAERTILANAAAAPDLATLVAAVKAARLDATLAGAGPLTVFAPTDAAFARLAPGVVDRLLTPENAAALAKVLRYHMVAGALSVADLDARVAAGGGRATLATIEGEPLLVTRVGGHLALTDVGGNTGYVEVGDVRQSNGIIHVVNGVLVPTLG